MGMNVWRDGKLIHSTNKANREKIGKIAAAVRTDPSVKMVALRTQMDECTKGLVRFGDEFMAYPGAADELEKKGLAKRVVIAPAPEPEPEPEEQPDAEPGDPDSPLPVDDEQPEPGPSLTKVDGPSKRKGKKKG